MSAWTHVFGIVRVSPAGFGMHAREFVLREVLDHLPPVTGSEGPMRATVVAPDPNHFDMAGSMDEFGQHLPRMRRESTRYVVVLEGDLRDRELAQTEKEMREWLLALARRIRVGDLMVRVVGDWEGETRMFDAAMLPELRNAFVEPSSRRDGFLMGMGFERCPDWRYSFMPDPEGDGTGNWTETLPYLVPGGASLLHSLDVLAGRKPARNEEERADAEAAYELLARVHAARKSGEHPWFDEDDDEEDGAYGESS